MNLLPGPANDTLPVTGMNIPATEVSGDFYDFFELADGTIYFNVADVSGKGMNAAMLMAKTSSLLHCLAKSHSDPGLLLSQVNNEVCETATRGMFVTIVSGFIDLKAGLLYSPMRDINRRCTFPKMRSSVRFPQKRRRWE